jgi:hypothetical protein
MLLKRNIDSSVMEMQCSWCVLKHIKKNISLRI